MHEREHASLDRIDDDAHVPADVGAHLPVARQGHARREPFATVHALRHLEAQRAEVAEVRLDL
jgi:hypothetical protein